MRLVTPSLIVKAKYAAIRSVAIFGLLAISAGSLKAQVLSKAKISVQLLLNLNGGIHNTADGFTAVFADNFSAGIGDEDSYKMTNIDENIAINRNGQILSIEGRPSIASADTIQFKMWQFRQKTYCLKLVATNFSNTLSAVLKDNFLHQDFPVSLADTTMIPFDITLDSASFAADRFCLVFKSGGTLPVVFSNVKAFTKEKGIQVQWTGETEENVSTYQIERSSNGVTFTPVASIIANANSAKSDYTWFDQMPASGNNYYRIKVLEKSGLEHISSIVSANMGKGNEELVIYPNPVRGNTIGVQLKNVKKGDYTFSVFNQQGQKVYAKSMAQNEGTTSQQLQLGDKLAKGIYAIEVKSGTARFSKAVVVE